MIRRSLAIALAAALLPMTASAADLLQVYEMARNGDPQLSAAESSPACTTRKAPYRRVPRCCPSSTARPRSTAPAPTRTTT